MSIIIFVGMLCLSFKVQRVEAYGTIYIRANGSIDPPTAAITTIDGITYTFTDNIIFSSIVVERDDIVIDGAGYTLQGTGAYLSKGIRIDVTGRTNVRVQNTQIKNFDYGIWLFYSSGNSICGDNITNNNVGIELYSSSNNSISGNNIANNNYDGIELDSSSDNSVFQNNLINNTSQVHSHDSTNTWDDGYPSGGNYWSDHNGTDSDQDGIGDTPYVIGVNNTDNYPLMGTFYEFAVPDGMLYNIATVSNFTILDLYSLHELRIDGSWYLVLEFTAVIPKGKIGFCRIDIPRVLINGPYHVFTLGGNFTPTELPISNSSHALLYFTLDHSGPVIIVPEFPSFLILPFFFVATLLAVIVYRRKHFYSTGR